jgi:hypothetical protein
VAFGVSARFTVFILAVVCLGTVAAAQDSDLRADRLAPQTRAGQIELERQRKSTELEPDKPNSIEHVLNVIKEKKILERLTQGVAGFRVKMGGLITGSGFAAGPEYFRHDLLHGEATFRASARGSFHKFYLMDTEFDMPHLADDHVFANFYAVHRRYPHIDYYGQGSDSAHSGRTAFTLEDTSFQTTLGVKPTEHFRIGVLGRYLLENIGPGVDTRFASTDRVYTEASTPGIQFQTDFLQGGAFVQYDWRDNPGGPRRGGNYIAELSSYQDIVRGGYSFDRARLEVQQYIPFLNQRRVIALRGRLEATEPRSGDRVPFYLQPTLGGSEDLRGFRPFRFYDNNAVILNGEYRWEVFSGLDMALFVDAGQVYHDWRNVDLRELNTDYGFGFRFNVRNDVFMRIDTAFCREGFQIWFKFNNVF